MAKAEKAIISFIISIFNLNIREIQTFGKQTYIIYKIKTLDMNGMRRYFQWLVGDDRGKVVEFIDITQEDGEYFYNFDDGESCNMSYICPATNDKNMLKGKAMVEVPGPHNAWKFEEIKTGSFTTADDEHIVVPPLEDIIGQSKDGNVESAVGTMRLIAPKSNPIKGMPLPSVQEYLRQAPTRQVAPQSSGVNIILKNDSPEQKQDTVPDTTEEIPSPAQKKETVSSVPITDPVHILVNTCKKHDTEISMTVNISLPSLTTYNFAKSEFENGGEKFIDILAESIDMTTIAKSIKDAIKQAYESQTNA